MSEDRSRRAVLATAGALATGTLAGCLGGGAPTEAPDPWVTRTELSDPQGIEGRLKLKRGQFWSYDFAVEEVFHLRLRARSRLSLSFDAMTFQPEDLDAYLAGETADAMSIGSVEGGERAYFDRRVPAGEYTFVLDNTRLGESPPFDEVDLFVRLEVVRGETDRG